MKLLFKQRFFSWFDSYDIYNEAGDTVYTVKGKLAWGHCLKIFDAAGNEIGTVKERVLTFLPKFELYLGEQYMGCISKEFTFFRPKFNIDCNGWQVDGDWFELGLHHLGRSRRAYRQCFQGALELDGHLCDRCPRSPGCPVRPDAGAGN